MKNKRWTFVLATLIALTMTSCGNSIEKDAQRFLSYQCEMQELVEKMLAGDEAAEKKMEQLEKDLTAFNKVLEEKYGDPESSIEFLEIIAELDTHCD